MADKDHHSTRERFDALLSAMVSGEPKPLGKPARGRPASSAATSEDYSGTQTRRGKSASASSKPKRKSR